MAPEFLCRQSVEIGDQLSCHMKNLKTGNILQCFFLKPDYCVTLGSWAVVNLSLLFEPTFSQQQRSVGATRCPKRWLDNAAAAGCHASTHPTHLKRQLNRSREIFLVFWGFLPRPSEDSQHFPNCPLFSLPKRKPNFEVFLKRLKYPKTGQLASYRCLPRCVITRHNITEMNMRTWWWFCPIGVSDMETDQANTSVDFGSLSCRHFNSQNKQMFGSELFICKSIWI